MDIEQEIRNYLPGIMHMSLATVQDNKPWVCEVHFVYDDDLNLYFRSKPSRRHSQEIAANLQVAGNIVTQHSLGQPAKAVYFEGQSGMMDDSDEIRSVAHHFKDRLELSDAIITDPAHKFYKITVQTYYVFGAFNDQPAQKYELKWSRA